MFFIPDRMRYPWVLNLWAVAAAFGTYFCMYMYRKPFTAAGFVGDTLFGLDEKPVLVSAQVIGYLLSKIIGIRLISEVTRPWRAAMILALIAMAQIALLLFAIAPRPWHVACMFLNGLPLGMVFGLVLGSLEGRRMTEALAAGLCASFILAGGVSKTLGQQVLDYTQTLGWSLGLSERWMPFLSGLVFLPPVLVCCWMLHQIPPPDAEDEASRSRREPMRSEDRRRVLQVYSLGLAAIAGMYLLLSILRSLRDDFAREILLGLGTEIQSKDYANIDFWVMLLVTVVNGSAVFVKDNQRALRISFGVCASGFAVILLSVLWHLFGAPIDPKFLMVLLGAGLYLPYVAVHTTVFERIIACTRDRANVGFLMYVADSVGYFGYAGLILGKNFFLGKLSESEFAASFLWIAMFGALISIVLVAIASIRFRGLTETHTGGGASLTSG